ncbi:hypothetical protein C2E23DRAFT_867278 [Lenzites betulinus]|nr:hypothetical protein C2E23DRAFT_867278 [Lenzites betulinus]
MADVIDLSSNPFVAPKDGRCLINDLPSELLAHIFSLGWTPERDEEPDEDDFEDVDSEDGSYSTVSSDRSSPSEEDADEKERKLPFNVLVSHVCARWRAIAVDNPLLWSHIRFVGLPPYDRAKTYLERAKAAPLHITVDRGLDDEDDYPMSDDSYEPEDDDVDLVIIESIMELIIPHVPHWQSFRLMVSFYRHMHCALQALGAAGPAPMLEVLQLYHHEDTDEHLTFALPELREQPFCLFGGVAPRLTHVALWGVHLPWTREGSPFLTGLVDLELAYHARDVRPSLTEFARILRASPGLRPAGSPADWPAGLPETIPTEGTFDADAAAPLALENLTDLVLAYHEPAYLLALLPRLALPALTSLALDLEDDDFSEVLAYLSSPRSIGAPPSAPFWAPSASALRGPGVAGAPQPPQSRTTSRSLLSQLTALKIASVPASEAAVREAYRQLQALTALNLNAHFLDPYWVDLLFPPEAAPPSAGSTTATATPAPATGELLLPRLETLTTTGVSGGQMRALVAARQARGVPLRALLMNQDDDVDSADGAWLDAHVERFEFFEGSDEEDDLEVFEDDADGDWEDEDEDEDFDYEVHEDFEIDEYEPPTWFHHP